jgi:hypothetical protein
MVDFILNLKTDSGSLSYPKVDQNVLPAGADPTHFVSGSEWNTVCQALVDTRKNILSGSVFGFGARYASPGDVGLPVIPTFNKINGDYLYVRSDGALVQHKRDNSEFVLAAAAANVQYSQYAELDTLPSPVSLPALTQGSAILYLKSNGSSTPGQRRSQLVIRWGTDNSDTVIAEGPAY